MDVKRCQRTGREREAVYTAEAMAFGGTDLDDLVRFANLVDAASSVLGAGWWPGPVVTIRRARADAFSSSASSIGPAGTDIVVRISGPQMNRSTLIHELAHALAGVEHGHDRTFRRATLDVTGAITNAVSTDRRRGLHVDALADAYARLGLDVGTRSWPSPPPWGAIAL